MTKMILIFKERFTALKAELGKQIKDEAILNERMAENLSKIDLNEEYL